MKSYLLLLLLLCPMLGHAQTLYEPFEIRMIDSTSGSKEVLYARIKTWVDKMYHTNKEVVLSADADSGRIVGKGSMMMPARNRVGLPQCEASVSYVITIEVKNGRYRAMLNDFRHAGCFTGKDYTPNGGLLTQEKPADGMSKKQWAHIREETAEAGMGILRNLNQYMQNEAAKVDEWK